MDVGDHTSAGDGGLDKGIKLLVTSDGQLQMSWSNSLDLQVFGCVSGELKDLSGQVLEDSSSVHGGGSSDSGVGCDSALQESVDSSDWELY